MLMTTIPVAAASKEKDGPTVWLSGNAIIVSNLQPHGEALLFGVTFEPGVYTNSTHRWQRTQRDEDGDGSVTFSFEKDIPQISIWAGVDVGKGTCTFVTPGEVEDPSLEAPAAIMKHGSKPAEVVGLELTGRSAFVLVVRGGAGAWSMTIDQNGTNDADLANPLSMVVDPEKLETVSGNAAAPKVLTPGDLVVIIDTEALKATVAKVVP
jgi:hypothetical protein